MTMSAAICLLAEEQLLCGVCLEVFNQPVTIPCGHNFCKVCITQQWDSSVHCHCPTCQEVFSSRLELQVNTVISEMAHRFRRSANRSAPRVAKPGEVPCDMCPKTKMRALRSCLVCMASYCEAHLKPHMTVPRLKRHQLTDPMQNLDSRMCATHEKPLELFCSTDQTCVCMLCPVLDHKSHDMALLKDEFEKKKAELARKEEDIHRVVQERRQKIREIKRAVKLSKDTAQREISDGVRIITALKQSLKRALAELTETIEERQKATEKQAKGFIQELEQEVSELLQRQAELEHIASSRDHLEFLQSFGSQNSAAPTKDWTGVTVNLFSHEGTARLTIDQLQETLNRDMKTLLLEAELNRARQFAVDLSLDPDTAHRALILSDDGKQVRHGAARKNLPDNPKRFDPCCCVMAKQCFSSGKFYFEAQVQEKTRWTLGVAKESIRRKGVLSLCPENGHWAVWLKNENEYAALVGSPDQLSVSSKPKKVGVFVDYDEGLVSFYDTDTAVVLYSFTGCSFSEKLYPFFSPGLSNGSINAAPLIIINHADLNG